MARADRGRVLEERTLVERDVALEVERAFQAEAAQREMTVVLDKEVLPAADSAVTLMTEGWRDDEVDTTFAQKAGAFIEQQAGGDSPFFLYLCTSAPHCPCEVRPDFVNGKSQAGDRGDMVVLFDWVVGQVIESLDRTGLAGDTLVIATSDNGARLACANGETYGHK